MSVQAKIVADMNTAMESGDKMLRSVTRMLLSELNYAQDAVDSEIDDQAAAKVIENYKKHLVSTLSLQADEDQLRRLKKQISIVEKYLS